MSEFRHDPVYKRWVVVAVARSRKPTDYEAPTVKRGGGFCPFCEGNEDKTPPEIYAVRKSTTAPNKRGWSVRVFANKYPVLAKDEHLKRSCLGFYDRISGVGVHEVVVESPRHDIFFHEMDRQHMISLLDTYRRRLEDLMQDSRFRYVLVFKSHGMAAGASLHHPHSQIIATPVIPSVVTKALVSAKQHFQVKERCLFCDILEQELFDESRIVVQNEHFLCYCPFASRYPFEVCILPKAHHHDFSTVDKKLMPALADIIREAAGRLAKLFGDPPFNMVLHTCPNSNQEPRRVHYWQTIEYDWHWRLEIIPRLVRDVGFEWATGIFLNPTPPEDAAGFLRGVELKLK